MVGRLLNLVAESADHKKAGWANEEFGPKTLHPPPPAQKGLFSSKTQIYLPHKEMNAKSFVDYRCAGNWMGT
jgi:hypothetical protein